MGWRRLVVLVCALTVWLGTAGVARADPDTAGAQAFLDETLPAQLAALEIPGATAVVVSGDQQVAAGGYGTAELGADVPIDPENTVVPINSVGKILTATAVMQQVERGALGLDTDVDGFLRAAGSDIRIPDTYPGRPILLRDLLGHTSGFDELILSYAAPPSELGPWLAEHVPDRVREPGGLVSYSNYAYALAGHLVELADGRRFADYLGAEVLAPLGMDSTYLGVPEPAALTARRASTYVETLSGPQPASLPTSGGVSPVGIGVTTAADMGRLMSAMLTGGAGVLSAESVAVMQARQVVADPRLTGLGYPFHERTIQGNRLLTHAGDGFGSHGMWAISPTGGWGLYVAYTGDGVRQGAGAALARDQLLTGFVERVAPGPVPTHPAIEAAPDAAIGGAYAMARTNRSGLFSLRQRLQDMTVTVGADGAAEWRSPFAPWLGEPIVRWSPTGPDLYARPADDAFVGLGDTLAFLRDADGAVVGMAVDQSGATTWERVPWFDALSTHLTALAGAMLVLLLAVLGWPLAALVRRARGRPRPARGPRTARLVAWSTGALALVTVAALGALHLDPFTLQQAAEARAPWLLVLLLVPVVVALGAGAAVLFAVAAVGRRWWTPLARVRFVLATAALLVVVTFLGRYHLVGWQFA